MTGIFVSYSRKDADVAHQLIAAFKSNGLDVWVDWEDIPPAAGWLDQVLQGIEAADAFLFLISPDSIASEVCNVELEHAHKNAKRIIPIVVRDTDPKATRDVIRSLNWIFIRPTDDFAIGLEKIKVAISLDLMWLQEHRRLQVRALEWDRQKDASLLLRGGDLRKASQMILKHEHSDPVPSELQRHYIRFSKTSERVRVLSWVSAALALLVMLALSAFALDQRQEALINAAEAQSQRDIAEENRQAAEQNARAALAAKAAADKNATIAEAQRSAARAQIYQSKAGGLFTSALLALDSYQRNPSAEAEEILRENISLLPVPAGALRHTGAILVIKVSPDGSSFIAASGGGTACLVRFESGENIFCSTSAGSVLDAAFSPDGKTIVTGASSGEVRILDAESGNEKKKIELGVPVLSVNISPDGRLLALARDDGRINLIKLSTYQFAGELSVFGNLNVTAFSPDGSMFAAGSDAGSITIWDLQSGYIISGGTPCGEVRDIIFSPNSQMLLSGGTDNCATLSDTYYGEQILVALTEEWVEDVDFSPDGAWFVTASNDFRIRVWDVKTGKERLRLLQDSVISEVKVSPDGLWIASTGSDNTVRVWNAADGSEMFQIPLDSAGNALAFSGDGRYLVVGDGDGHVKLWDISALKANTSYIRFDEFIGAVEMSADGKRFAASASARVWLLDPGRFPAPTTPLGAPLLDLFDDEILDIVMNPAGTLLAVSTAEGKVVALELPSRKTKTLIQNGPTQSLALSADGSSLILASEDGLVQTRSLGSGEDGILLQADEPVYSIQTLSADTLAIGMDDRVILFDMNAKQTTGELESPGKNHLIAADPTGGALAINSLPDRTTFWRAEDGNFVLDATLIGEPITSMAFTPDGSRLFLGAVDKILVYDPVEWLEVNRIREKGETADLAFSPDGNILYAASMRTLRLFDIPSMNEIPAGEILAAACSRVTQNFSAAEWESFFEDEEYRLLCPSLPVP